RPPAAPRFPPQEPSPAQVGGAQREGAEPSCFFVKFKAAAQGSPSLLQPQKQSIRVQKAGVLVGVIGLFELTTTLQGRLALFSS
ncbi:hypothetical protein L345_16736, partial [Ophiophagus hannah]